MVSAVDVPVVVEFDVDEELVVELPVVAPVDVLLVAPVVEEVAVLELPFAT